MNREDIIRMARKAGIDPAIAEVNSGYFERLVEIVRADEREKYKWDIHSCGPTCKRYACVATREAIAAEREAVLDLVDDYAKGNTDLRDAIRARGTT